MESIASRFEDESDSAWLGFNLFPSSASTSASPPAAHTGSPSTSSHRHTDSQPRPIPHITSVSLSSSQPTSHAQSVLNLNSPVSVGYASESSTSEAHPMLPFQELDEGQSTYSGSLSGTVQERVRITSPASSNNRPYIRKELTFGSNVVMGQSTGDESITTDSNPELKSIEIGRSTKVYPGRIRKRVILKNGVVNLSKEHVDKRGQRYVQDIFTTMVDIQWRWNLLAFTMSFFLSWLGFAVIWWLIAYAHGDLGVTKPSDEVHPCVVSIDSFATAFLFSVETQHTIGYGSRYLTDECPEAIMVMCLQCLTGVIIQCFVVGFVFAKLSRPQKRSQTLLFSRQAVIGCRDGRMCLMFRIGDVRNKSHIIGASIRAQMVSRKQTQEGEILPYYHTELPVRFDSSDAAALFLIWPATVVHEITEDSPFFGMSADDLQREKFEVVAILEGTIESTGQSVQAKTSYLPGEINWGYRFEQMVTYRRETGEYRVDYSKFHNTYDTSDTPTCSAKEFYDYQRYLASRSEALKAANQSDISSKMSEETKVSSTDSGTGNSSTSENASSSATTSHRTPKSIKWRSDSETK